MTLALWAIPLNGHIPELCFEFSSDQEKPKMYLQNCPFPAPFVFTSFFPFFLFSSPQSPTSLSPGCGFSLPSSQRCQLDGSCCYTHISSSAV